MGKDGTPKTRSKPGIFARLGLEENPSEGMLRGARDAFDRYLRKRFGDKVADRGTVEAVWRTQAASRCAPARRSTGLGAKNTRTLLGIRMWTQRPACESAHPIGQGHLQDPAVRTPQDQSVVGSLVVTP